MRYKDGEHDHMGVTEGEHDHMRVTDTNENVLIKLTLYNENEKF